MDTFTQELSKVDRAILDGETEGFVRVHVRKGTDELVGATVVAAHAGDLIGELTLVMIGKLGLKTIGATIHPYEITLLLAPLPPGEHVIEMKGKSYCCGGFESDVTCYLTVLPG